MLDLLPNLIKMCELIQTQSVSQGVCRPVCCHREKDEEMILSEKIKECNHQKTLLIM